MTATMYLSTFLVLQFLYLICGTGALLPPPPEPPEPPSTPPSNVSIVASPEEDSYSYGVVVVLTCNVGAGSAPFTYGWILNGEDYLCTDCDNITGTK